MAVLDIHFHSDALQVPTAMTVILPQHTRTQTQIREPGDPAVGEWRTRVDGPPVLYLLHGLADDESTWLHRTSIDRYAEKSGLAVVMPRAGRSFYQDEAHGAAYWTFLSEELPEIVHGFLRVSTRREDTFVAGLSMGGYGAMRWALAQPWRFSAAASLSGSLDLAARAGALVQGVSVPGDEGAPGPDTPFLDLVPDVQDQAFGHSFQPGGESDLIAQLGRADASRLPDLWVSCGRQDPLRAHSESFVRAARAIGADPHVEYPDGVHEWGLWDAQIHRVLEWLPLE